MSAREVTRKGQWMREMTKTVAPLPKGTALSRFCMALAQGDYLRAAAWAERWPDTPQVRATIAAQMRAKSGVDPGSVIAPATWGSELAMFGIGQEAIEALRPNTVLDRAAAQMRHTAFRVRTARESTPATAGAWVGENKPAPVRAAGFSLATQPNARLVVIVAMTRELLSFSEPSAEADFRDQFIKAIARALDLQFLDPNIAPDDTVPRPGSILHNADAVTSTGSTASEKLADLTTMIGKLVDANVPMRAPYWVMKPSTALALASTTNASGNMLFPDIRATGGTLLGIPVLTSTNSPQQIALFDAAQVLLSDDGKVDIEASEQAALQMDDAPASGAQTLLSLYQNNLCALRFVREIFWQMAHVSPDSPAKPVGATYMEVPY